MKKLIIFDWDDVFTKGSTAGYHKCYHEALVGVGVQLSPAEEQKRIAAKWGSTQEEELGELLQEHPELVAPATKLYEQHLHGGTFIDCLSIVEGSPELLARLSDTYTLALATGMNPQLLTQRVMPKFRIPDVFAKIMTVYDLDNSSHAKPHPYMNLKIMEDLNIQPEYTVMVGDAGNDVRMAQAAGIEPIVVLTGHLNRQDAESLGVKHIIDDVTQLETVLKTL